MKNVIPYLKFQGGVIRGSVLDEASQFRVRAKQPRVVHQSRRRILGNVSPVGRKMLGYGNSMYQLQFLSIQVQ